MLKNKELDQFIICKKCNTLHKKIPLHKGGKALCSKCNTSIYKHYDNMVENSLALVVTALISLSISFQFTIITININGLTKSLSLLSLFDVLLEHHQYIVGIIFLFLIILFPFMILSSLFFLLFFIKKQKHGYAVKRLLIFIAHIQHWNMLDIFFISLLVAMVKLFDYAKIEFGVSFVALLITLILELMVSKNIDFDRLWQEYNNTYGEDNDK